MPDQTKPAPSSAPSSDEMKDAARLSQEAGIADESAAYEIASEDGDTTGADDASGTDREHGKPG